MALGLAMQATEMEHMMSEFDKLKDEAEKEAQQHPQQVKEGEQAVEKDLGHLQGQSQQNQGNTDGGDQGQGPGGQDE